MGFDLDLQNRWPPRAPTTLLSRLLSVPPILMKDPRTRTPTPSPTLVLAPKSRPSFVKALCLDLAHSPTADAACRHKNSIVRKHRRYCFPFKTQRSTQRVTSRRSVAHQPACCHCKLPAALDIWPPSHIQDYIYVFYPIFPWNSMSSFRTSNVFILR